MQKTSKKRLKIKKPSLYTATGEKISKQMIVSYHPKK